MAVDAAWVARNLGTPATAASTAGGTMRADSAARNLPLNVIEFDSEAPSAAQFFTRAPLAAATLAHYVAPPWPAQLAPISGARPSGELLPPADVLVVTWTVDEGHALSRVLTPDFDSQRDWKPYTKNFAAVSAQMRPGCPARELGRLGTYWTCRIGQRNVTLFKSDSHMSQDGPGLANKTVWEQIIADTKPQWVISTGTGGGIGASEQVGDVIVSRWVSFDCRREFARLNGEEYSCSTNPPTDRFLDAASLFAANAGFLPTDNTRPPAVDVAGSSATGILTTDFFGFDTSTNIYGLQGHGALSEMGDAVLGMVCAQLAPNAPKYCLIRNVSDPQIDSAGLTTAQQAAMAADIYKAYGRWSSVCSAIVTWAVIAAL